MTPSTLEFLAAVSQAPLLAHVGEPLPAILAAADAVLVANWAEALRSRRAEAWSEITLDARGDLTSFLAHQHPQRDASWNEITRAIRPRVLELVTPVRGCGATRKAVQVTAGCGQLGSAGCLHGIRIRGPEATRFLRQAGVALSARPVSVRLAG